MSTTKGNIKNILKKLLRNKFYDIGYNGKLENKRRKNVMDYVRVLVCYFADDFTYSEAPRVRSRRGFVCCYSYIKE